LTFEGDLVNFCSNGWGIASMKDKFIYKGSHSSGKFDGYGEIYYPEGGKFFGFFKDNIKNGLSINFSSEGKVTFGKFISDLKHGPFVIYYKNLYAIELFNFNFRSRLFEKYESAKIYFKTYYPEFDWVARLNMKKIIEYFTEIKAEEYIIPAVPELPKTVETAAKREEIVNSNIKPVNGLFCKEKKEITLVQKIREAMRSTMDSA